MNLDITEYEYEEAVDEICRIVDELESNSDSRVRSQDVDFKKFIAAIYDNTIPCDILGLLAVSDIRRQNMIFVLLIGRCKFGRPDHKRTNDILAWSYQCRFSPLAERG